MSCTSFVFKPSSKTSFHKTTKINTQTSTPQKTPTQNSTQNPQNSESPQNLSQQKTPKSILTKKFMPESRKRSHEEICENEPANSFDNFLISLILETLRVMKT